MYLKSIDILGYKSFALKTHVDLEPGITGIIGPNGCGKSNIMECVRWCLGEMSWRSLRADSMVDVIFAGTAKRPALGMTEVTLTFDNASSMLPVQFSEVTVTRRIYRSAESAYFLNKTQCRLRDIREMFLDTGLGGDGYAIIDQGGVDFVLSAKPEERRSIFEEAAGVAKYKAKREEALRKLERVDMDLGRLQDSVSLIDEQVRKLDSDARKAKLFKKYKEELAGLEAAHIVDQATAIENELAGLSAKMGPLQETLGAKRVEMDGEGANHSALNLDKSGQQGRFIESNQRISETKGELGRLEERLKVSGESLGEMAARADAYQRELIKDGERLAGIDPDILKASDDVAAAQTARAAAVTEAQEWQEKVAAMSAAVEEAEQGLCALRAETTAAVEEGLGIQRRLSSGESTRQHREGDVRRSLRELEKDLGRAGSCEAEVAGLGAEAEAQQVRGAAARAEAAALESALADLRRRQAGLSDETLRLHTDMAGAKARAESLETQGGQNPYWVGAQTVLGSGIPGLVGTVRSLFKADENVKPYLEDLLGERLYAVVCEDSSSARAGVEFLQAAGKGRVRFLVLSSLPEASGERTYPEGAKPLLRGIETDPRREKAMRFLLEESYALGKTLFGDHWVYGGAPQAESVALNLSGLDEVRARAAELEARAAAVAADAAACSAETTEAESRLRRALDLSSEESRREHSLRAQLGEREQTLAVYRQNAELSTGEATRSLAEMAALQEELVLLREQLAASTERARGARRAEEAAASEVAARKERLAGLRAGQGNFQQKLEGLDHNLRVLAGAYERLAEEKTRLEAGIERRRREIADLAAKREETRALQDQSRQAVQVLGVELARRENEAKAVFDRLQELDNLINEREANLRVLKEICETTQGELHQFDIQSSSLKTRSDLLKNRLWDEWQLPFDEAKTKFTGIVVDVEKIETLRRRISNMGNINMAAPEEYEALSQRQTFLAGQINDLNQAKEDLKAAIQKINGTTRENFRQTFTDVREHFRRLYGVLFEGGEADLVLTDPENILETGIEIVAQPPGKRLQSISLLSGGEKTLTAIALLFAFFMVKPSPFCMLDEADAALDDANIERFVALLREFQSRSQFLIVSHNKRTMEAADVIYGVTMEELGVSQLISVDFRKKKDVVAAEAPKAPETHGPFEKTSGTPAGSLTDA